MNYIVLVKQVPDVSKLIPPDAWDREKGTLRRGVLDNVLNPLDVQALTFACRMAETDERSRIACLTMGPPQAKEVLWDSLARGADEGVLLTDRAFAGADTIATSYTLAQGIRKIERDVFQGSRDYIIVTGMQSTDGDTAQVPPQIAEELGIEQVAYAQSFEFNHGLLRVTRIGPRGMETLVPDRFPILITTPVWSEPIYGSFHRARRARSTVLHEWDAKSLQVAADRIGLEGSRTQVYRIFSPSEMRDHECVFPKDMDELVELVEKKFRSQGAIAASAAEEAYCLDGKTPTRRGEVWVYIEQEEGVIQAVSLELLGEASKLAESLNQKVGAVLLGHGEEHLCDELIARGADKVYWADHPLLEDFLVSPHKKVVTELVLRHGPQVLLFGATPVGRELAPRVAYRTNSGLTADCTKLEIGDYLKGETRLVGILKQTRPALGGNIMATIMTRGSKCQMATVRPGVMRPRRADPARQGEIVWVKPDLREEDLHLKIASMKPLASRKSLADAEIIVSGGKGLGSRANFDDYVEPLAAALRRLLNARAEVGASRLAVEDGFRDHGHQVGQTGQTVQPKLYVAVGISGAVQHISGMQHSDTIVAINKDPNARIFSYAHFGVSQDFQAAVPALIEAVERRIACKKQPRAMLATSKS
ncbi:MAG: FAD-binding protein [Pirellulales bacterium]|nr:FAD-binding protein [Pirellulales bacterium]